MITLISFMFFGFFLGMRHATDADHVIAVSTIVSRERKIGSAALLGMFWGLGHSLTIFFVGGTIILFGIVIPPRLGLAMEFSVALMLILLGLMNLTGLLRWIRGNVTATHQHEHSIHDHPHRHGDYVHSHPHRHAPEIHGHDENATPQAWLDRVFGRIGFYQILRPIIIGIVHGLAGSAALALLVLTTIREPLTALAYLLVFGLGTIAGMMLITVAMALPFAYSARRFASANRHLATASGVLSLIFGLFLAYRIGFVEGLFTQ
ncbi:high-affinity nickel-transport family protein [candidate division KSB1 bacterium]|nr:MAG: high-affinity nickel-transport family protein [candidate division KSB1 bacterium]